MCVYIVFYIVCYMSFFICNLDRLFDSPRPWHFRAIGDGAARGTACASHSTIIVCYPYNLEPFVVLASAGNPWKGVAP